MNWALERKTSKINPQAVSALIQAEQLYNQYGETEKEGTEDLGAIRRFIIFI